MANKNLNGKTINCGFCEKPFYIPKNRFETAKFCSLSCKWKAEITKEKINCLYCNKEFEVIANRGTTAKYCSNPCKGKAYNNRSGTITTNCGNCGIEIRTSPSRKRIFCSNKCRGVGHRVETFKTNGGVRKALKARGLIVSCQKCGYSEHPEILGVHHKNKNRHDNRMENLIVLCPNCHSLEHARSIVHSANR